ncbi:hypothetical protein SLEP1_g55688 [Rubroshorea leprosula]|uniref:Uncharacterized protein n=1 Tax=Rubroshorea leprosula TaxID=152421 RepID=A0AAV5MG94_9ROSI|nr:hypothetical protein SLEP1_g55688 [Rubroshorea leprosula]
MIPKQCLCKLQPWGKYWYLYFEAQMFTCSLLGSGI